MSDTYDKWLLQGEINLLKDENEALRAENARMRNYRDEYGGVLLEAFGALKKLDALYRQQVNPSPETMDKIEDLIAAADEIVGRAAMGESDE